MKKIFVSGSVAFDTLMTTTLSLRGMTFPEHEIATHSILSDTLFKNDGGTGANISYNLSLLGCTPTLISSVGSDAEAYIERLKHRGVDTSHMQVIKDMFTAYSSALTDSVGNQVFFFCPGAMNVPSRLPETLPDIAIIAPGNHADMKAFAESYRNAHVPFIFDPGQMVHSLQGDMLMQSLIGAHTLIVNEFEWGALSRKLDIDAESVLTRVSNLIITRGEKGASLYSKEFQESIGALQVHAIDGMGAGDAFRAGYIWGILEQKSIRDSVEIGNTLASFCVEHHGTQSHRPHVDEISKRYRDHYKKDIQLYTTVNEK